MRTLSDAEAGYLEAIAEDCRQILGRDIEILDLRIDDPRDRDATVTIRYRLDGWEGETGATGTTVIDAHAALRAALVADRLRLGFSALTDPRVLA